MNLKNYTTEVPASRSIEYIEKLLVEFGATNIMKQYEDLQGIPGKICSSMSFIIPIDAKNNLPFRLPANVQKVAAWLRKKKPNGSDKSIAEQANRIAWKQQYEILHLQLGQIEMNQLEKLEVFFPYLYDVAKNETYYQKIKAKGFQALLTNG